MKRKNLITILKVILFITLLITILNKLSSVLNKQNSYASNGDYLKENYDIVFIGSSHVLNGVFPMDLWNNYGYVSYNLADSAETNLVSYYKLLLAMQETKNKPKLVVIDAYTITSTERSSDIKNKAFLHTSFDMWPASILKFNAIKDILGDENIGEVIDTEIEYLFPFSKYHNRWNDLKESDFVNTASHEKGAIQRYNAASFKVKVNNVSGIEPQKVDNINAEYLCKTIEYCKDNGIEVLVTFLPFNATENQIAISKYAAMLCNDLNVKYINFLENNVTNFKTDYSDEAHLNSNGARKVTKALGEFIKANYDIPNRKEDPDYTLWTEEYNKYVDYKIKLQKSTNSVLREYLVLLGTQTDIKYQIVLSGAEITTLTRELINELNQTCIKVNKDAFTGSNKNKMIKITTWDARTNKKIETLYF